MLYIHKGAYRSEFFILIISYRVRGEAIYALIIKSLYCCDYFSNNNLEQYIYLNVLD